MNILWMLSAGILLATVEPLTSEPTNEWAVVIAGGEHVARAVADECNFTFNGRVRCYMLCLVLHLLLLPVVQLDAGFMT